MKDIKIPKTIMYGKGKYVKVQNYMYMKKLKAIYRKRTKVKIPKVKINNTKSIKVIINTITNTILIITLIIIPSTMWGERYTETFLSKIINLTSYLIMLYIFIKRVQKT